MRPIEFGCLASSPAGLDRQDLERFVHHQLDPRSDSYKGLKSKHFLIDGASRAALAVAGHHH